MAISRYWRLVGVSTPANGVLELSEVRLYEAGVLADASATLTSTVAPASGTLADLRDGLATGVVAWPYASYSAPGFALVWDFGAGGGVEFPQLRLGSGNSNAGFLEDVIAQSSVDAINWTLFASAANVVFPGKQVLAAVPWGTADPYFSSVALLLHGNGVDGSTNAVDSGPSRKSLTPSGNVQVSTAQRKFGGSSLFFATGGALTHPSDADFGFGTGDFTVECWVYLTGNAVAAGNNILDARTGLTSTPWTVYLLNTGAGNFLGMYFGDSSGLTSSIGIPLFVWTHLAITRASGSCRAFVNGVVAGTSTFAIDLGADRPLTVGNFYGATNSTNAFPGFIDELRITKGVARYTSNFPVPTEEFSGLLSSSVAKARQVAATPERLLPAIELPPTTAHGHLREFPFFDVFNGGIGLITGTVKEKSLPSNVPLARKVWLMDEASGMVVRETWSDAATGTYEFRGVKQGVRYTVLAYDYTGLYRAVIADAQVPGVMS